MKELCFVSPRDGDMLSDISGTLRDGKLELEALVEAPEDAVVTVNGVEGRWCGGCYRVPITLEGYQNTLTAVCGDLRETAVVYWLPNAAGKYALSVDDNIWFLADLTKNQDVYTSIFDNLYLHVYKLAHEKYGTKVRLNLFYEMDNQCGIDLYGKFDLSMMTEKFKDEFRANAHWLRFAFHSRSEFPDNPYVNATGEQIGRDFDDITREIIRFAGEECLELNTTNHWGSGTREAVKAMRQRGVEVLMGYLKLDDNYEPSVSYYLDQDQVMHAQEYGFWKDHETDMIFGQISVVLNEQPTEPNLILLNNAKVEQQKKGYVEFMIHEQYFYPTYVNHKPDFTERILSACQWATENGYKPAFITEITAKERV